MSSDANEMAGNEDDAGASPPEWSTPDARSTSSDLVTSGDRTRSIMSEVAMVAVWTVAADLLIFRAQGYFAVAAFFAIALCSLIVVHRLRDDSFADLKQNAISRSGNTSASAWIAAALLIIAILRLSWAGSVSTSLAAAFVFIALALSLSGWLPTLSRIVTMILFGPFFGADRLPQLQRLPSANRASASPSQLLAVLMPLVAVVVFGGIFVLANPDLVDRVSDWMSRFSERLLDFFSEVSFWELPFCVTAFFVGIGLLRPLVASSEELLTRLLAKGDPANSVIPESLKDAPTTWYHPARNTLIALIALFAAYLVFEFKTLWKKDFPDGFYYAGYAHEGAAWLTVALALATLTLSLIFHARMFCDSRVNRLKTLAWVWSAMNLLLAVAVYNRLWIYVGYNGMTRMRTVGFFGITLVLVGFGLVIFKIIRRRSFTWLIQSQLIALSITVVLYCLFPVDYVAHRYNAARVANGYLKPSVMIAVKPINDEGVFPLLNLVNHPDPVIRDGVHAMLAERQLAIESYSRDTPWHWHRYQYSKTLLYQRLDAEKLKWARYLSEPDARQIAIEQFKDYAMQWY
ncbi:DUF4153 domain-containing protein [Aporhodopirellula aestuarii]|uniref:DUF4173 domain-containing protein n=1 Tax=Aporhodopirellula aestuarii TaxID=2950107 RepID=A0ABT0UAI0_9BACT|nr:DUF4153 domain-containing protein [Aporhodopirellula aestuarii]MCM2373388.1 DUF4173 domain-containing protein [Aporhodopirellula aestuarii]